MWTQKKTLSVCECVCVCVCVTVYNICFIIDLQCFMANCNIVEVH